MAYIIFISPDILTDTGMPHGAMFVAICIAAAIDTIVMGIYANYPIAMASGIGLNAYFAYAVVRGMGFTRQATLGVVFISGCLFLLTSVFHVREIIVNGVPHSIRVTITASIRLFPGIVSLRGTGLIIGNPATFATLGDAYQPSVTLAVVGFFVIVALDYLHVKGAILTGILAMTAASFFFAGNIFYGVMSMPPSLAPTPLQLGIMDVPSVGILNVVLAFLLVELFGAAGTLMDVASRVGLLKQDKMDRLNKALLTDSTAIMAGSLLSILSVTVYIESTSGMQAGGRIGLTVLTVAALFLLCLSFSPLAGVVPAYATASVLLYVSCLMLRELVDLNQGDTTETVPAALTALVMLFIYSIANGVALGFIIYLGLKPFADHM